MMDLRSTNVSASQAFRSYMLKIYAYMGGALIVTGLVAFGTSTSPAMLHAIYGTPLKWVVMLLPLVFVMVISFGINNLRAETAQTLFWLFAAAMGVSLASIFLVYTGLSIAKTFLVCAAMFLIMSIYGYITGSDLSRFGSIMFMGLIGIIIASLVNIFLKSNGLDFAISVIGVLVFAGLTAWDVQKMKLMYNINDEHQIAAKKAVIGALALYLDFLNLFLMLLRLMGNRRD